MPACADSDRVLVERHQAGDPRALGLLMSRHNPAIRRHLTRYLRVSHRESDVREAAIDDLVQMLWIRVNHACPSIDVQRPLQPWLYTIVNHLAINEQRNRRRRAKVEQRWPLVYDPEAIAPREVEREDPRESARPDYALEAREEHERLQHAIQHVLTHDQREVMLLRGSAGGEIHQYDDIARELGIPLGTVRSRLCRARRALQQHWQQNG